MLSAYDNQFEPMSHEREVLVFLIAMALGCQYRDSAPFAQNIIPTPFPPRRSARHFSRHEAFRDVSGFQIKMSVDRADLSGDVKPRDRFLHRIEDALLNVVLRPA